MAEMDPILDAALDPSELLRRGLRPLSSIPGVPPIPAAAMPPRPGGLLPPSLPGTTSGAPPVNISPPLHSDPSTPTGPVSMGGAPPLSTTRRVQAPIAVGGVTAPDPNDPRYRPLGGWRAVAANLAQLSPEEGIRNIGLRTLGAPSERLKVDTEAFKGGQESRKTEAEIAHTEAETKASGNKPPAGSPEQQAFNDLMTGENGGPRIDPATQKPYTQTGALAAVKQAGDTKKTTPNDVVATPEAVADYQAKVGALGLPEKAATVYGGAPAGATIAQLEKRYADAESVKKMGDTEAQTKITDQMRTDNATALKFHQDEVEGLKSVQYKDKDGVLRSGTMADAKKLGAHVVGEIQAGEVQKSRTAHTQYDRMIENAQTASDSMAAWDNPEDKRLASRIQNDFFSHVSPVPGIIGIDPKWIDTWQNTKDYEAMTPAGRQHMQNMTAIWSDAINLMKQETGGVPRGEQFLKVEGAILPQAQKTQDMNRQSLQMFEKRIKKDSSEYARPNDMEPMGGVVPVDATHRIMLGPRVIGYVDKAGKNVLF
jgi:hypothetical protein